MSAFKFGYLTRIITARDSDSPADSPEPQAAEFKFTEVSDSDASAVDRDVRSSDCIQVRPVFVWSCFRLEVQVATGSAQDAAAAAAAAAA